jgi:hypothetical protein
MVVALLLLRGNAAKFGICPLFCKIRKALQFKRSKFAKSFYPLMINSNFSNIAVYTSAYGTRVVMELESQGRKDEYISMCDNDDDEDVLLSSVLHMRETILDLCLSFGRKLGTLGVMRKLPKRSGTILVCDRYLRTELVANTLNFHREGISSSPRAVIPCRL